MFKPLLVGLLAVGLLQIAHAQTTFPKNGVYDERPGLYAFTNATIVVDPQTTLTNATLLIRDGRVSAVGTSVKLPAGTVVTDLRGKRIYPALIDIDSDYGMPEVKPDRASRQAPPQIESKKVGPYYWNQAVQPENDASQLVKADDKKADELRKMGFGAVLTHPHDGLIRGTGALVTLADDRENMLVLKPNATAHYSFSKGSSGQTVPSSMMGSVAVLRQAFYDADWYKRAGNKEQANLSLDALNRHQGLPALFEANDKLDIMRADKVGDEFGIQYIIRTGGDEYQRLDEVKATGASLIVPVDFPEAYDVDDAWDADNVTMAELKHWEMAPTNAGKVAGAGIPFALTTAGLKKKTDFWANLRKAIANGLTEQKALEALTTAPARFIRADDQVGTLQAGKIASFIITSGNLFDADNIIYENWIRGKQYIVAPKDLADLRGKWRLAIVGMSPMTLEVTGKSPEKPDYQLLMDTTKIKPTIAVDGGMMSIRYQPGKSMPGTVRLTGYRKGAATYTGTGELPDGKTVTWSMDKAAVDPAPTAVASTTTTPGRSTSALSTSALSMTSTGTLLYPFVGLGNAQKPQPQTMLIRNATVWTNEKDGILKAADVLVQNGKIAQVGTGLNAPTGAVVIDGTGKHLTSGIIDEHSHIALLSVNEGSQSSTAEVRMADVVNSEDVNIYRQLAGGVTASQLLHGSANAIGGQSALIKLKWGEAPAQLLIPNADGFIKFALGENVKQANWGDANRVRFPQTRMGVEQVFMDHFTRAKEYAAGWAVYNNRIAGPSAAKDKANTTAPRRDIELDALAEILANKRFITCHSYVQSEINMLLHVADSLGFKVNTFTHILEGYKVADKMAKHGAGGSTFADWWAYKMEVHDAIPYNAALMNREGVTVSINSDDAEMARRLNQEAAKTVEYGGIPEEDAWKMVTLNPARLLHLDSRMGSIRAGKDADLVLWNANPLAIYARPEKTIIDGTVYFDLAAEDAKRATMQTERARLVQKMLAAKAGGSPTTKPTPRAPRMWHCEDLDEEEYK